MMNNADALRFYSANITDDCFPYQHAKCLIERMQRGGFTRYALDGNLNRVLVSKKQVLDFIARQSVPVESKNPAEPCISTTMPEKLFTPPVRIDKMVGRGAERYRLMATESPVKLDIANHLWPWGRDDDKRNS